MQPDDNKTSDRLGVLEQTVSKMDGRLEKILSAVVGDPEMGQEGLVARVIKLEDRDKKYEAVKNKFIGASIVGGAIWAIVAKALEHFFK